MEAIAYICVPTCVRRSLSREGPEPRIETEGAEITARVGGHCPGEPSAQAEDDRVVIEAQIPDPAQIVCRFGWERDRPWRVVVSYQAPVVCSWIRSTISPLHAADPVDPPAGWSWFEWTKTPDQAPPGRLVWPHRGEDRRDAYRPHGWTIGHYLGVNTLIPGMLLQLETELDQGPSRPPALGAQFIPYGTRTILGGTVIGSWGEELETRYQVNVAGWIKTARPSDHVTWAVGDFVFLLRYCCRRAWDAEADEWEYLDCASPCDGDAEYSLEEGYPAAYHQEAVLEFLEEPEYIIAPLKIGTCGA